MSSSSPRPSRSFDWAEKFAQLLDSKFTLPGTNFRFGLDPILGLIPGVGDGISLIMQGLLINSLWRSGYSGELLAKLCINVLLDTLIGTIPIAGQIFDFFFKANERNLRLTREYLNEGKHQGSGKGIWLGLLLIVLVSLALFIWLFIEVVQWLINLL